MAQRVGLGATEDLGDGGRDPGDDAVEVGPPDDVRRVLRQEPEVELGLGQALLGADLVVGVAPGADPLELARDGVDRVAREARDPALAAVPGRHPQSQARDLAALDDLASGVEARLVLGRDELGEAPADHLLGPPADEVGDRVRHPADRPPGLAHQDDVGGVLGQEAVAGLGVGLGRARGVLGLGVAQGPDVAEAVAGLEVAADDVDPAVRAVGAQDPDLDVADVAGRGDVDRAGDRVQVVGVAVLRDRPAGHLGDGPAGHLGHRRGDPRDREAGVDLEDDVRGVLGQEPVVVEQLGLLRDVVPRGADRVADRGDLHVDAPVAAVDVQGHRRERRSLARLDGPAQVVKEGGIGVGVDL